MNNTPPETPTPWNQNLEYNGTFGLPPHISQRFDEVIAEALRKRNVVIEEMTERQVMEAFLQACACGDFQRLVKINPESQAVTYVPFRNEQRLKARVRQLEEAIEDIRALTTKAITKRPD